MNKKIWVIAALEALILLLIIAIVLIPSMPPGLRSDVTLTTGKATYSTDETIVVTVKNNSNNEAIWFNTVTPDYCWPNLELLGKQNGNWASVPLLPMTSLLEGQCNISTNKLEPGDSVNIEYQLTSWHDKALLNFSSYKLGIGYALAEGIAKMESIPAYSNEFTISAELSECDALESEIKALLEETKYCEKDDDCILDQNFSSSCFLGCFVIRSKLFDEGEQLSLINEKIGEHFGKCTPCLVKCGIPPEKLACEEHKCVEADSGNGSGTTAYSPNTNSLEDRLAVESVYKAYIDAGQSCDIELATSIITERTKEIVHYTCSNMHNESKCYVGKEYEIKTKPDIAMVYLTPPSHSIENPFFFSKENGEWKLDLYRMAFGMAMAGSTCNSGWSWTSLELRDEYCSYFEGKECPDGW